MNIFKMIAEQPPSEHQGATINLASIPTSKHDSSKGRFDSRADKIKIQ